ncbi:helix-turn-helix domain-containing protein [Scytonema sp. UIC 10036]|uniref:helix-turn-helix domain-containing protein n=1 Tax=Scytonema sp. UIC 10036 TaxID=2304196 RepID=UPI0012DA7BB9|nr:helix-turn-helix domain-containing protein [Scytonema sp. UIC 10036]MUG95300.1 helix-turn-helix domain-containing protein [Scytonema sp. UIC 10036]
MTRIIDRTTYGALLAEYQPKVIETEEENEAAIVLAEALEHRERTPEEDLFLQLLIMLIEKFEDEHYQIGEATPQSILLHLMEARGIKQEDLVGIIGSLEVVSEVVNGKRNISKSQAKALAEFFHVSLELFL